MKTKFTLLALLVSACSVTLLPSAFAADPAPPAAVQQNLDPIEVCFVLDTTGSMGGLIAGAQQKIWAIANDIVKANPKRPLKFSLVAYRDRGDVYITKVFDLTEDLDAMYKELMALKAEGGGDEPESVNQALQDAVEKVSWSKAPTATKLLFLVGDAPPHMDYPDDVKYPVTLEKAVRQNIIINTIQCGSIASTKEVWQTIAKSGEGTYLDIAQNGGVQVVSAPQDKKLADLTAELNKTVVPYGSHAQQAEVITKANTYSGGAGGFAGGAGGAGGGRGGAGSSITMSGGTVITIEAAADRAAVNNNSGGKAIQGEGDLVQDLQSKQVSYDSLPKDQLPENLQKMTDAERKTYLDAQIAKRKELNDQIAATAKEREEYIKTETAKRAKADSFDEKVVDVIKDEITRKK